MTNARPDALSLAMAVTISSSIIATQTLADRRLQIKSVDIQVNEQVEFTQSEVMVQPTLGHDQQPIPKSFTTSYPDQTEIRAGYEVPSEGFTDVLSGIGAGVASVDLFETDDNDVAQKYTKVLKVGDEGVFRFTHNLAEEELVIEVRKGMTDQNSIAAVRAQSGDIQPLEPLTKIANREQLTGVLKGASERAGSLGEADHYVALATIKVDKVAVNGRSFMRHIVSGDRPPEMQRLGQSLFINDEALLAAATSAYAQVHVLGEDIQQEALDKLLSYHKPVGYVVHVEDHTQAYPAPAGYPKLEVDQASEEVVVFRGQKQNPTNIAFVESQHIPWEQHQFLELTAEVKKASIRSYRHVIRSSQMALLEEFAADLAAQHDVKLNEDKLAKLAYYEAFQQALTAATPDGTDEFEFTTGYIRITTSLITPIWMQLQLIKNFSFKPVLKNLLTNYNFFQNLHNFISFANRMMNLFADAEETRFSSFSSKVLADISEQMLEIVSTQEELKASKTELILRAKKLEDRLTAMIIASDEEKQKLKRTEQTLEHESERLRQDFLTTKNMIDQLRQELKRIPELQKQVRDALAEVAKVRSAHAAAKLGIDGWDDTLAPEEQAGLLEKKIHETGQSTYYIASGQPWEQDLKATLAAIEGQLGIVPDNENNLGGRSQSILDHLQQQADQSSEVFLNQLAFVEGQLGLVTNSNDDPEARQKIILEELFLRLELPRVSQQQPRRQYQQNLKAQKNHLQKLQQMINLITTMNKNVRDAEAEKRADINTQVAAELGIDNWDDTQPLDKQASAIREKILEIKRSVAATDGATDAAAVQPWEEAVKARLAPMESMLGITLNNENDLYAYYQSMQQQLQQKAELNNVVIQSVLTSIESQLSLPQDNGKDLEDRHQTIQQQLNQRQALIAQQLIQQQNTRTNAERDAEKQIRYSNIAAYLNIQDFDSNADPDVLQEQLIQNLEAINAQQDSLRQQLKAMSHKLNREDSYTKARKDTLPVVLGIDPSEDTRLQDRTSLESKVNDRLFELSKLKIELEDIKTPGHPKLMPEVLATLRDTLRALQGHIYFDQMDSVYVLRQYISEHIRFYIREARRQSEEEVRVRLDHVERLLNIKINEADYKTVRLERILTRLDADDISNYELDEMRKVLWWDNRPDWEDLEGNPLEVDIKRTTIRDRLNHIVEASDQRARKQQESHLIVLENKLNIHPRENPAAKERGKSFTAKLQQLDEEVFKAGQPDVNARIAAIDNELDRQLARLGPKPRYLLDRDAARARWLLAEAESELDVFHRRLNRLRSNQDCANAHGRSESHEVEDELILTGEKSSQVTGRNEGTVGKVRHPVQEQAYLEDEIEIRKADIERLKEVLETAEQAVENDGGPFQYSPGQVKVRTAINAFAEQHSLKKQALETTMGLAQLALESDKKIPHLSTFDFDDEFAPIHLQALVGDKLTFKQAGGIVEVFKSLKKAFPESSFQSAGDLPGNDLQEVYRLVRRARHEMKKGALEYDDEIRSMGKAAVHFIKHQSGYLKSFPEYFATHSASGNKIISLLREGLISKVELENYIKAVRNVDGYQTVAEFEHFLGYQHGVRVPEFRKVVQMLSDRGADEFMQSAFTPVPSTASGPAGMKESVSGMKEYAAAVIANYVLDDIAFDNGRRMAALLANVQDTLTPYAHAAGISESVLIETVHGTLIQAHAAAVERQLLDYWIKPSAFLVQAVTWYFCSYKPLLAAHTAGQATALSLSNMSFLYLLDLTNRGDYLHRMLTPFQHWLEGYGVDPDRTGQYAYHSGIEQISELGGLAMPLGKAASSVILLRTGSMLFARQYNANPQMYRSISRLVPEIVQSMSSGQGVQIPLLHRLTPQKVKTLASATAGLVLGPVATAGTYAHGLLSGFTYAQTFGFALASSLTFDFFMNDNKMLTQWLGGPLGRSLDKINRWTGVGEATDEYVKRTTIARPQRFDENDEAYANLVTTNNTLYGWTRHENYLHFRERRDRTMKLFENGWEKYFRENVPKWSFSHAQSIPYFYTFGAFYKWQQDNNKKVPVPEK
ncbi:hypothetical protein [Endozoicomonas sp. ALB032]|uniref:hypothetical protein n=1 Tax=Endozoicomonas sp. ALB032 TaxID=3403082 RepID=UPI003BB65B6E